MKNYRESEKVYKTDIRPLSDYFTDYTDTQIYDKLNSIVHKYDEVNVVPWRYGIEHTIVYPTSQASGYRNCVKNNKSDWWLHCDVDEYFILKKHENFKELIVDYSNVCSFHFYQRRFQFRERNNSVREIYECKKDFYLKYPKSLVDNKIYSFGELTMPVVQVLELKPFRRMRLYTFTTTYLVMLTQRNVTILFLITR